MKRIKRFFTKRRILVLSLCLVVFVMSLGYAALTQYVELDGIASIDRSWIVKVTKVTNTVTNSATSISSNYVSNTVTLNANLPTSSSTITYTITLSNQGNIPAKLNNIEIIEDENSNITYEISGVEEEVTTLAPGETNTVQVTIKYKSGVTNISETKKELMLTFIYIDNSKPSSSGGSSGGTEEEEYEVFKVGEKVELIDGTIWYVTKNSSSNEDKVTLVSENTVSSNGSVSTNGTYTKAFDSNNTNEYDQFDTNNIGYYVKNTVETYIKNSIKNSGGNITGTTARLLTKEEYDDLIKEEVPSWMEGSYWLMSNEKGNNGYYFNGTSVVSTSSFTSSYRVRPVIITLKSNVEKPIYLKDQILEDNVEQIDTNIDFSKTSEEDGTKGLYYTNTNTEDGKTVYYYRGAVENNYVYFAGYYWRIIRINEDGSVRLIYQGETPNAIGEDAIIGYSAFNANPGDNSFVGYMHGIPTTYIDGVSNYSGWLWAQTSSTAKMSTSYIFDSKTGEYTLVNPIDGYYSEEYHDYYTCSSKTDVKCKRMLKLKETKKEGNNYQIWGAETHSGYYSTSYNEAHSNDEDSTIKIFIENWYRDNLLNYNNYIADSGFCNDRSLYQGTGIGNTQSIYSTSNRLNYNKTPQFSCPNKGRDLFTVNNKQGNSMLQYPIGLITADEIAYAGGVHGTNRENTSYYLYSNVTYWSMSPVDFRIDLLNSIVWNIYKEGFLNTGRVANNEGVRPVINLKSTVEISSGNGTSSNPYVIKTNE